MKKSILLFLAVALVAMSFTNPIKTLNVDVAKSIVTWKGYKPTGSHNGTIMLKSGLLQLDGENIVGGKFTADMKSIKDADGSARLENHLKSVDFFEVETFETAVFEITAVENKSKNKVFISGNIVIKGITKEISFTAEVSNINGIITLKSDVIQLNRAEFNVKYKSKTFFNDLKEKFINDEFDLQVSIVTK